MVSRAVASAVLISLLFASLNGCGGDKDYIYPSQAVFRVEAATGTLTFRVKSLASGSSEHCPGGDCGVFSVLGGTQTFILINSQPPYQGVFEYVSGDAGTVTLATVQNSETRTDIAGLSADHPAATVFLGGGLTPVATDVVGRLIRFEFCAPFSDSRDVPCSQDPGISGLVLDGTIGDLGVTHLIEKISVDGATLPAVPAVVFLDDAHDSISGVVRVGTEQLLRGEVYLDGKLEDKDVSKKDVVLKADL